MADTTDSSAHVEPFIHRSPRARALHFSIHEVQSLMQLDDPDALALQYTRTMMGFLLMKPQPARILMIGLGGGSLAKFCHRHLPATHIEVVELNPHVIALRDEFLVPPDSERFSVLRGDGSKIVRLPAHRCDVLLVDGFDSDGMPQRLASRRFYDDCFELLAPGGIMVVNLHHDHAQRDVYIERMRRSFQGAVLVVDDGDRANTIVFAGHGSPLDLTSPGPLPAPSGLGVGAADQLRSAFELVNAALQARQRQPPSMRSGPAALR